MTTKVSLNYLEDKKYETFNESGNKVAIDMLDKAEKMAQSPMELLLSALVACAAVDLALMIKKRRKTLNDIKAEASGTRREEHPKYFTDIQLHYKIYSPDLTEQEAERLVKLSVENYCSVGGTLSGRANITHSFEIIS